MHDSIAPRTPDCEMAKPQGRPHDSAGGMSQQWRIIALLCRATGTWAETPGARMTMGEAATLANEGILTMRVRNIKGRTVCEVMEAA